MHICPVCLTAILTAIPFVGKAVHHYWHKLRREKPCESDHVESCSLEKHETSAAPSYVYDPLDH